MKPINRKACALTLILSLLLCGLVLSACSAAPKKTVLRVILIPKFEIGEMSGDFPGEAQLFYEKYCAGCEEVALKNAPPTAHLYVNEKSGVAMLVTGSGKTTAEAKAVMAANFPARETAELLPAVRKGTALSGDNYWKGIYGHVTAVFIADYYQCPDPYMATEMEEIAIANTADCFGMLDRLISLRVIVNTDVFLDGETPDSTWGEYTRFSEKVENKNTETLDIFEPAMHNLFDASEKVIDAILQGTL